MRENEMIKHSGNKVTKQAGRQNYKTGGKTKWQNKILFMICYQK